MPVRTGEKPKRRSPQTVNCIGIIGQADLSTWLETHGGPEWEAERIRMLKEHRKLFIEIIRDSLIDIRKQLRDGNNETVDHGLESQLTTMKEFPEVLDLLKKF